MSSEKMTSAATDQPRKLSRQAAIILSVFSPVFLACMWFMVTDISRQEAERGGNDSHFYFLTAMVVLAAMTIGYIVGVVTFWNQARSR